MIGPIEPIYPCRRPYRVRQIEGRDAIAYDAAFDILSADIGCIVLFDVKKEKLLEGVKDG